MQKSLMIGGCGYIGSRLCYSLGHKYNITTYDFCKFSSTKSHNICKDYANITKDELSSFDNIILLAGHSSVRMCDGNSAGVLHNNIVNFVRLLDLLDEKQTLIYASSASVYGNCKSDFAQETTPHDLPYNMYDMSKQAIDSYVIANKFIEDRRIFGLRFGTVNGFSPILRDDVMINAMVSSAWREKHIKLFNPQTRRSILGITDLVNCIDKILSSSLSHGGIYNVASFSSTSIEIAQKVSKKMNVPIHHLDAQKFIIRGNEKLYTNKYDFSLDCTAVKNDFNFTFYENVDMIVDELVAHRNDMIFTNRNEKFDYP